MSWLLSPLDIGLQSGLIYAWVVLALAMSFRLLAFPDLTVEGSFALGAGVYAAMLQAGRGSVVAVVSGLLAGAAAGALTGLVHVRFRLNKFLCGILVVAICYSITLRGMAASNIGLLRFGSFFDELAQWDSGTLGHWHWAIVVSLLALVAVGMLLLLRGLDSRWGMRLRVAGSSPEFAHSLGLPAGRYLVAGLALTNSLAALSGILLASRQGFADVGMGQGILILALAALTLGERLTPERRLPYHHFVVVSAVAGSLFFQVLSAIALRLGLAATDLKLATALLVLAVVALRWTSDGELLGAEQT